MRNINSDPYEPELGQFPDEATTPCAEGDNELVTKTGTTTVGLTVDADDTDCVVIATDRRASLGGRFVSSKNVVKVEQIHPTAALTLVGSVGGAQSFIKQLRAESSLYEARRRDDMSMNALATLAGNFARGGPFRAINPILGGLDEDGPHVFTIDPAGGVMEEDYTVTGSGMQVAYGHLEDNVGTATTVDDARHVAATAVKSAAERDTASGNGLALATITADGVDIETYDDYPDEV